MSEPLYIGNDHVAEIRELKDATTGAFINDATVTVTLYDADGDEVGGGSWPAQLAYVTSSNGVYRGMIADEVELVENERYTARIIADGGAGRRARWDVPCYARLRTGP